MHKRPLVHIYTPNNVTTVRRHGQRAGTNVDDRRRLSTIKTLASFDNRPLRQLQKRIAFSTLERYHLDLRVSLHVAR